MNFYIFPGQIGLLLGIFLIDLFGLVQMSLNDCQFQNSPLKEKFNFSDLSLIPSVYKPFVMFSSISINNILARQVPNLVFANMCASVIDLSNSQIELIQNRSFSGLAFVQELYLDRNQIMSIDALVDSLDTLDTLTTLDISFNRIQNLTKKFPSSLATLEYLFLMHNRIEFVTDRVFENLANLNSLLLKGNRLKSLSHFALYGLSNLRNLDLSRNFLNEIDDRAFDHVSQLHELQIDRNLIRNMQFLTSLIGIERLYLNSNKINLLPTEIFSKMNVLVELDLSKNDLNQSISFAGLENVSSLNLQANPLGRLNENSLQGLNRLTWLFLSQTKIESIRPGAFNNCSLLYIIDLTFNQLRVLENDVFRGLSALGQLYLDSNVISVIEARAFHHLPSLEFLSLSKNLLVSISGEMFQSIGLLINLDLSGNRLKTIARDNFEYLPLLTELKLNDNSIESIEPDSFRNQTELSLLDLHSNRLKEVKNFYFEDLKVLTRLDLKKNRLNSVDRDSFKGFGRLEIIDLSDNFLFGISPWAIRDLNCSFLDLSNNQLDGLVASTFKSAFIQSVSLAQNNLDEIGDNYFDSLSQTSELKLSFNRLKTISNRLFSEPNSSTLKRLFLDHNFLTLLDFLNGTELIKLENLDVSFNKIERLARSIFQGLTCLRILNVSNNDLKIVDGRVFRGLNLEILNMSHLGRIENLALERIRVLDLSSSQLSQSRFLENGTRIQRLYLRNIGLNFTLLEENSLPDLITLDLSENADDGGFTFANHRSLEDVCLSKMGIKSISRFNIFLFLQLKYLNLSLNFIESIKKEDFSGLKNLAILDVSFNRVRLFEPNSFENINSLKEVYMENNRIDRFSLSHLSLAQTLMLANNLVLVDLIFVSQEEGRILLQSIRKIDVSYNALRSIRLAPMLSQYNSLEILRLSHNRLCELNRDLFVNMDNLRHLTIDFNEITRIEFDTFWDLDQLEVLNLANNSVESLDFRVFSHLLRLRTLNLSSNRLETIDESIFSELYNLQELDISFNWIKMIDNFMFKNTALLQNIHLNQNGKHLFFSNYSFFGLTSLRNLYLSWEILNYDSNKNILLDSLSPQEVKRVGELVFFRSINILFDYSDQKTQINCNLVLEFAKRNMLVNLLDDFQLILFFTNCLYIDLYVN